MAKIIPAVLSAASVAMFVAPRLASSAVVPGDVSSSIHAAEHEFNMGNYSQAIRTLQSAVSQSPSNAEACYWLGRSYYEMRDYDNAIAQAEKSVALDAKNSLYHDWLGRAYGGKADRDHSFFLARKVKKEFEEAVRLDPSNISARRDLEGYCIDAPWIVGGSKDEANAQVTAIAAIDPVAGHLARAEFDRDALKKDDLAESEYRQVLAARPRQDEPYFEVAQFFAEKNKPSDIEAAIAEARGVSPNDPRLEFYQAVAWVLAGAEFGRAEEYLKSYLASTPDRSDWPSHAQAREWLGRLYEAEGKPGEAAEQYRAALQLDPGMKEPRERLQQLEKTSH